MATRRTLSDCVCAAQKRGRLELIFGPMFSGKSTELLRRMKRLAIAQHRCLILKHAMDARYSDIGVATHDHQVSAAFSCRTLGEMRAKALDYKVIGIDEGQFFSDIVPFCEDMANLGKTVVVAALDGTFQRKVRLAERAAWRTPAHARSCRRSAMCWTSCLALRASSNSMPCACSVSLTRLSRAARRMRCKYRLLEARISTSPCAGNAITRRSCVLPLAARMPSGTDPARAAEAASRAREGITGA